MKLRNKKTGEIVEFDYVGGINVGWCDEMTEYQQYHSRKEFNEEWEDYEEPKIIGDWECSYMSNDFREGYYILAKVSNREIGKRQLRN